MLDRDTLVYLCREDVWLCHVDVAALARTCRQTAAALDPRAQRLQRYRLERDLIRRIALTYVDIVHATEQRRPSHPLTAFNMRTLHTSITVEVAASYRAGFCFFNGAATEVHREALACATKRGACKFHWAPPRGYGYCVATGWTGINPIARMVRAAIRLHLATVVMRKRTSTLGRMQRRANELLREKRRFLHDAMY